jgi:hypothetical protein
VCNFTNLRNSQFCALERGCQPITAGIEHSNLRFITSRAQSRELAIASVVTECREQRHRTRKDVGQPLRVQAAA